MLLKAYVPLIHFPQKLMKLYINIPFKEALALMLVYMNIIKEMLIKKTKLEEYETIVLSKECSVILPTKLPPI